MFFCACVEGRYPYNHLKLTDGQFESVKIKTQNAKLLSPPAADS